MVDISRKAYERNDIEIIVDNNRILWLNEKHIQERLDNKNLRKIATKYYPENKKQRYELVSEPKKQCNRIFVDEKLRIKVIMDCRTTSAHKFRTRFGFKENDVVLTKEKIVLTKIKSSFGGENMKTEYVLGYRFDSNI